MSQKSSCGNAVPTQFLMWERRYHAFPPHYTTGNYVYCTINLEEATRGWVLRLNYVLQRSVPLNR